MLESTRAKEAEVKKETNQQLDAFRKQQEEAEQAANQQDVAEALETEAWRAGPRKRKKGRESAIGGVKLRRTSTAEKESDSTNQGLEVSDEAASAPPEKSDKVEKLATSSSERSIPMNIQHQAEPAPKLPSPPNTGLGLSAYSSDEDG